MGESNTELNLRAQPPAVVLMAGLQGSGTTQAQKMMKKMKGGGMNKMLRGLQGKLPMGGLPPFKP